MQGISLKENEGQQGILIKYEIKETFVANNKKGQLFWERKGNTVWHSYDDCLN